MTSKLKLTRYRAKAHKNKKLHRIFVLGIGWKVWSSLRLLLFYPLCPKSIKQGSHLSNPCMPSAQQHQGQNVWQTNTNTHTHIWHTSANSYKDPAHMLRNHFPRLSRSPAVWSHLTLKVKDVFSLQWPAIKPVSRARHPLWRIPEPLPHLSPSCTAPFSRWQPEDVEMIQLGAGRQDRPLCQVHPGPHGA